MNTATAMNIEQEDREAIGHAQVMGGRAWKARLRRAWMDGDYSDYFEQHVQRLARLRNVHWFGPAGLVKWGSR